MIFHPQNLIKKAGSLVLSGEINAIAHPCLNKIIIKEFWHNFTFQSCTLNVCESKEFIFSIGNTKPLLIDDCDYSINVDPDGICIFAENEKILFEAL